MTILLLGALVIGGLVVWGLMASRKQRRIDRRHYAAFVGFSAAVVAVAATALETVMAGLQPHPMDPVLGGLGFVIGVIAIVSIAVTFFAGLFSLGTQGIALVSCGIVVAPMYLSIMSSHFGDWAIFVQLALLRPKVLRPCRVIWTAPSLRNKSETLERL